MSIKKLTILLYLLSCLTISHLPLVFYPDQMKKKIHWCLLGPNEENDSGHQSIGGNLKQLF